LEGCPIVPDLRRLQKPAAGWAARGRRGALERAAFWRLSRCFLASFFPAALKGAVIVGDIWPSSGAFICR